MKFHHKYFNRIISLLACTSLMLCLCACGSSSTADITYDPLSESDSEDTTTETYHICILSDSSSDYYQRIISGFTSYIEEYLSGNTIVYTTEITESTQLIFTVGSTSLLAAADETEEIPIVATGIMDFQSTLHITAGIGDTWNKTTGRNITGVSTATDMTETLSLIIETTSTLNAVGLLYTPDDSESLYQLSLLEEYLDEASIPWKEYALPLSASNSGIDEETSDEDESDSEDTSSTEGDTEETDEAETSSEEDEEAEAPVIITPSLYSGASVTEGSNNDVILFGEGSSIDGLIAPNSVHEAAVSSTWTTALSNKTKDMELTDDSTLEEIIAYACCECSALFIPAASYLADSVAQITEIASTAGVTTIAGDSLIGENTLTCTYWDPYYFGYAAAEKAYSILIDGKSASSMKITSISEDVIKVYNSSWASVYELSFPKSFTEINDLLAALAEE